MFFQKATLRIIKKKIIPWHPLSSVDISLFSLEIRKFCYINKYRFDCILIHNFWNKMHQNWLKKWLTIMDKIFETRVRWRLVTILWFHKVLRFTWYFLIYSGPKSKVVRKLVRKLVYTLFMTNNYTSFHLSWNVNLVNYQKASKFYDNDCPQIFFPFLCFC